MGKKKERIAELEARVAELETELVIERAKTDFDRFKRPDFPKIYPGQPWRYPYQGPAWTLQAPEFYRSSVN